MTKIVLKGVSERKYSDKNGDEEAMECTAIYGAAVNKGAHTFSCKGLAMFGR